MNAEPPPISVFIVEDHAALRQALQLLLTRHGFQVAGTAGEAQAAHALIRQRRPTVSLIDINLPGVSGTDLARRLLADDPQLGIMMYTGVEDEGLLRDALDCGARGFCLKAGPADELMSAIGTVAAGGTYVDPRLRAILLGRSMTEHIGVLSPRERQILDLLAQGQTGEEVAVRLSISPLTVRTHVRNAMGKLKAKTRVHAIAIALEQGEIDPAGDEGGAETG